MTKKTQTTEAVETEIAASPEVSQDYKLEIALQIALSHHKTNGGMVTPAQLIDNAKQFHAYITGETK